MEIKHTLPSPIKATYRHKLFAYVNLVSLFVLPLTLLTLFLIKQNYTNSQFIVGVVFLIFFFPYCAKNIYFQIKEIKNKTYFNTLNLSKYQRIRKALEPVFMAIAFVILLFSIILFSLVRVAGTSMRPTYEDGQLVAIKTFRIQPVRGKVYVLSVKTNNGQTINVIKRIYALPGDTVEISNYDLKVENKVVTPLGFIRFNDFEITNMQKYTLSKTNEPGKYRVRPNTYLFFGDNFRNSQDSRTGTLFVQKIIGEVI